MQSRLSYERVREGLTHLGMGAALESLDNALEEVRIQQQTPIELMDRLLEVELKARHDRRVSVNTKLAGLPYHQRLEAFDFEAQPSIDQGLIERLGTLRFIEEGTNVLFLGPPGVGKTALAIGLSIRALDAGHRVYFLACHDLVSRYRKAIRLDRLDQWTSILLRPHLLVLDEIGYTPLERSEATFLFEVISRRYDRQKPVIITSNKSWGSWGDILPDQMMAVAILDRLLHRSVTINIQGESYRLRHHRKAGIIPMSWEREKGGGADAQKVSNPNR